MKIINSEFIKGAYHFGQLSQDNLPEVAFIGRSNAGKSTLLNRLTNRKKLARVSNTPGKTQEINIYKIQAKSGDQDFIFQMADLPGYGYAKFAKTKRTKLASVLVEYFEKRENLKLVFILSDIRRDLNEEDIGLRDLLFNLSVPVIFVLTKADKISKNETSKRLKIISSQAGMEENDFLLSGEGKDVYLLLDRINLLCNYHIG